MHQYSLIVGYRNRGVQRVQKSLDSLAAQSCTDFELLFVDYGSEKGTSAEIKKLVETYSFARYVYVESRGWFWNRAHAMNVGLAHATGQITIFWDIDLWVEPGFLDQLKGLDFEKEFTSHRCYYLPENTSLPPLDYTKLDSYQHAYVGLCTVKTDWVRKIGGFDEFYQVWGAEDDDLYNRLEKVGLTKQLINADKLMVAHQWHASHAVELPDMWYLQMVEKLFNPKRSPLSPSGKSFTLDNRPALQALKNKRYLEGRKTSLDMNNKTLMYNTFLKEFTLLQPQEILYMDVDFPQAEFHRRSQQMIRRFNTWMEGLVWNFRMINRVQQSHHQLKGNVYEFLKYFVGKYRATFTDYYLDWREEGFLLILIK